MRRPPALRAAKGVPRRRAAGAAKRRRGGGCNALCGGPSTASIAHGDRDLGWPRLPSGSCIPRRAAETTGRISACMALGHSRAHRRAHGRGSGMQRTRASHAGSAQLSERWFRTSRDEGRTGEKRAAKAKTGGRRTVTASIARGHGLPGKCWSETRLGLARSDGNGVGDGANLANGSGR